jgi:hypothetical protein
MLKKKIIFIIQTLVSVHKKNRRSLSFKVLTERGRVIIFIHLGKNFKMWDKHETREMTGYTDSGAPRGLSVNQSPTMLIPEDIF